MDIQDNGALLLIDVQYGLDAPKYGQRNNPEAEANMAALLSVWRVQQRPVIHIQHSSVEPHSPLRPELPGFAIKSAVAPRADEPVMVKQVNSAFIGTNLAGYLQQHGIQQVVVVGLTTDHCVSTSVRMAANLGFTVVLVSDATATFERTTANGQYFNAELMHAVNLASLEGEFCQVVMTAEVLAAID